MRTPSLITISVGAIVAGAAVLAVRPPTPGRHIEVPSALRQGVPSPAATPAAPPPQAQPRAQTAARPATPVTPPAASAWTIPDPDTLPADDIFAQTVRRGRDLIAKTSSLIGPDAPDPAMRFAGNGLTCQSCHLQAGTQQYGLPLAGVWGVFPQYIGRENEVRTLEERVNGCMERSMNGHALPVDGPEMKAIITYIRYISGPQQVGKSLQGRGAPSLPLLDRAADPEHGRKVFAETCAACHGADGQGQRLEAADAAEQGRRYQFPPLWGPDSYNDGAGMGRTMTAARFVHANMPLGTTWEQPQISAEDAYDVMAFVNSQPRPHRENLEADYPDRSRKPVDAGYAPFVGPFTPEQHRYGPWKPIQDWLKANADKVRAAGP
ncbi:c-type cytochrome [Roseomonas sp. E05]|uniref:c-type cytochrome n=1 Tax=Roseomonas sp. E05 TaxID=3046310 RepID=UPI0024B8E380|nr:c-type cytochrome [Roseomonas sp. E05]MDJ0390771.1 c-type cytochrome [Roseomonas sp. E05]